MVAVQPNTPTPECSVQGNGKKITVENVNDVNEKVQSHAADTGSSAYPPKTAATAAAVGSQEPTADGSLDDSQVSDEQPDGVSSEKESAEDKQPLNSDEAVARAQAEVQEWQDKFMRLHAEWDTYRRRTGEQRKTERMLATEKLVTNLIPVIDDFERTIDYAVKNGEIGLLDGVRAVHTKFIDVLNTGGVDVINPQGEAFDALEAQAVATVEDVGVPDETVHEVYQKGYRMGSKVLRPAMVTVTTGGPKRERLQEEAEKK